MVLTAQVELINCTFTCKGCGQGRTPCEHVKQLFNTKLEKMAISVDPETGKGSII